MRRLKPPAIIDITQTVGAKTLQRLLLSRGLRWLIAPASPIVSGVYPTAIPWASHLPD